MIQSFSLKGWPQAREGPDEAQEQVPRHRSGIQHGAADQGLLYPITEVMSADTIAAIEPALLKNGLGTDGTQWAAPDIATSRMLAYIRDWQYLFTTAMVAVVPVIILFSLIEKRLIGGLTAGAVK